MPRKGTPPEIRFWWHVVKKSPDECWIWLSGTFPDGYGQFNDGTNRSIRAHRFSWELVNGTIPNDLLVCHKCDNRICVNPAHLFLGSNVDNIRDAASKQRLFIKNGVENINSTLTEKDVIEIFQSDLPQSQLADKYLVSRQTINGIKRQRRWGWLTDKLKEASA